MPYDTAIAIGSGGMGEVFKAWDPELGRWVALKYLRHDDPELVERLLREARAQARVDHPGVCKVYGVGEEDGRPFIAMQYVDGRHLHEAALGMTLEQKVLVVQQVAEAVQAAHAVGLIHRDLKPSNVMVAEGPDGELRPYVLDFGIAREREVAGLTVSGQVLGTPGYLSPEQARGQTSTLDRRTDIFSLGVILYELLSGARPFPGDSSVEVLVKLLEDEAVPLSRHLRHVPRDLETVVMRCLEKAPERRYPSARDLADDLGRFLAGEPVLARPVSRVERLMRLARRHRLTAALAVASVVLALGLLTALVGGWAKYTADLKRERDVAERKEREATEVTEFLVGIFDVADPNVSKGEEVTARELLDRGAERVGSGFADQPLVKARLLHTIGAIHRRLGLYAEAETQLEEAVEIRDSVLPPGHPDIASTLDDLGVLFTEQGRHDEAEATLRNALGQRQQSLGPDHLDVATTLNNLSKLYIAQGRHDEAGALLEQVLATREQMLGANHPDVATTLSDLGVLRSRQGRFDEAGVSYRRALAIREQTLGPDHPAVASALLNLAILADDQGRWDEAEALCHRALAIQERALGPDHPAVANTLNTISNSYRKQGRLEEAEPPLLRALAIREQALGRDHPRVGGALNSLGNIYVRQQRYADARASYRRAAAIYERALGPDHHFVAFALNNAANVELYQERYAEAEALYRRALTIREKALGPNHPEVALSVEGLAAVFRAQGRNEEAVVLLRRTLAIREQAFPPDHPYLADTRRDLAEALRALGREEEARAAEAGAGGAGGAAS